MQVIRMDGVKLEAVYACLPDIEVDNLEACAPLYGAGAADVVKGTGIEHRFLASKGISSLDLCVKAAGQLLEDSPGLREEIGAVVCVTFTPDQLMPANAIAAQHRLGLDVACPAFDVSLACSGYGYGLWLAASMAKQLDRKVLLLDGDVQSAYLSPFDKGTMPVLSDAGTASIIAPGAAGSEWRFAFYSDGSKRDVLAIKAGGSKHPVTAEDLDFLDVEDGGKRRNIDINMDGFEIFKFVAQTVGKFLAEFLSLIPVSASDVDVFVPHQANVYMVRQLAKKIGISPEKVWISGDKYGNSASATIPVTIASEFSGKAGTRESSRILLSGFGAGLSISAAVISVSRTMNCKLIRFTKE